eukprot:gene32288-16854_t
MKPLIHLQLGHLHPMKPLMMMTSLEQVPSPVSTATPQQTLNWEMTGAASSKQLLS